MRPDDVKRGPLRVGTGRAALELWLCAGAALSLCACGKTTFSVEAKDGFDAGLSCAGGTAECGARCVDLQGDPAHCGACDFGCDAGEVCSLGACGLNCAGGTARCGDRCVDLQSDPSHCGDCTALCDAGSVCSAGACGLACNGGSTRCGDRCVDVVGDSAHCGSCDVACDAGTFCSSGACGLVCTGGTFLCGARCVDEQTDPAHCGGCEVACDGGTVCSSGACGLSCSGGTSQCAGRCVDEQTDPSHCGACATVCAAGEVCSAGACALACAGGASKCGTRCVDEQTDPANCGGCGAACGPGDVCSSGACGLSCAGGTTVCGNKCVDTQLDPVHCGGCNSGCDAGQVCAAGACGVACAGGTTLCGATCVDTQVDPAHCGSCANTCSAGKLCSSGGCNLSCAGGSVLCGTTCVDTQLDPTHCGSCANSCDAGLTCSGGACELKCSGGTTACGAVCVDLHVDPSHCGDCTLACGLGQFCNSGTCECVVGELCNAACVNTQVSSTNCGQCGVACAFDETCVAGGCVVRGWDPVGAAVDPSPSPAEYGHALGSDGVTPWVAWAAEEAPAGSIYVHQFAAGQWNQVGGKLSGVATGARAQVDIQFNGGTPNVLFFDSAPQPQHVMKYEAGAWTEVGAPGYLPRCSVLYSAALALEGPAPYAVYLGMGGCGVGVGYSNLQGLSWLDWPLPPSPWPGLLTSAGSGNADVAWDGARALVALNESGINVVRFWQPGPPGAWVNLGGALNVGGPTGAATTSAQYRSIATATDGTPYVAWAEPSPGNGPPVVYVKRYRLATGWTLLGGGKVSGSGSADYPSIAVVGGTPTVTYVERNGASVDEIFVRRWDGTAWQRVGKPLNVVPGESASFPYLVGIGAVPYVAFREPAFGMGRVYVRRFP